jgi:hypothetical protein
MGKRLDTQVLGEGWNRRDYVFVADREVKSPFYLPWISFKQWINKLVTQRVWETLITRW